MLYPKKDGDGAFWNDAARNLFVAIALYCIESDIPLTIGVGKALLDHVAAHAEGPLSLKVQAPNVRAQAFYRREGFLCTEHGRDPGSDIAWLRLVRPG